MPAQKAAATMRVARDIHPERSVKRQAGQSSLSLPPSPQRGTIEGDGGGSRARRPKSERAKNEGQAERAEW